MSTIIADEPEALELLLSRIELTDAHSVRSRLARGSHLSVLDGGMTLVSVLHGEVSYPRNSATVRCITHPASDHRTNDTLRAGDALFTDVADALHLEALRDADIVVSRVQFSAASLGYTQSLPRMLAVNGFREHGPAAAELAHYLGAVGDAARTGNPTVCLLMHRMLLLELIRVWAELGCAPPGWPASARDAHLDRAVAAIEADPGGAWTVDTLARISTMSRTVFAAAFREQFGVSPARFVAQIRMARAARLLESGASVAETANAMGYASIEGFSRRFRQHLGIAPSSWQSSR